MERPQDRSGPTLNVVKRLQGTLREQLESARRALEDLGPVEKFELRRYADWIEQCIEQKAGGK